MPQLLKHMHQIARDKGRDVLWVTFYGPQEFRKPLNRATRARRKALIQFLDEQQVGWEECSEPTNPNLLCAGYTGSLYLDVPYDPTDPKYRTVADYLETPDGECRYVDLFFLVLRSDSAIKNTHRAPVAEW